MHSTFGYFDTFWLSCPKLIEFFSFFVYGFLGMILINCQEMDKLASLVRSFSKPIFSELSLLISSTSLFHIFIGDPDIVLNKRPLGLTAPLSNCLCYTNDV